MPGYYFIDFENVTETQYRSWMSQVSEERLNAAVSYRFKKDSMLSLAAYLLLAYALRDSQPALYRSEFGKPYLSPSLSQGGAPFFNLSHADGIAACYLSEAEVAIDVEPIIVSGQEYVSTICSPEEQRFFEQSGFSDEYLTRFWVLKESCMKSIGQGLSIQPNELDFSRYRDEETFSAEMRSKEFSFHVCPLSPGFLASVCLQGVPEKIVWTPISAEKLQQPFE